MKLVNDVDDHLRLIREEWSSRTRRPVPVGLYIWSERGGLGKTEFVRRIAQVMKSRVAGFNDRVYSIQPASAHFAPYYGKHTMHYDEVGAVRNTDEKIPPFTQINNIMSGNTIPMPSASLGGKNQIPKPHLVIMTSNCDIHHVDTKVSETARQALILRMLVYEFCDVRFNPNVKDARQNQPHRKADFSHIRFRNGNDELTVEELADMICEKLSASLENVKMNDVPPPKNQYILNGKPLTVDKNFSADDTKFLHWFAGKPRSGKSRMILPHIRELTTMINVNHYAPTTISELQSIKLQMGDVFVLDDIFDLSSETHQLLLVQWYNALPSMCKVTCISNYGANPSSPFSYMYRLKKHYEPIDIDRLKPALPRRIGFTLSDEARFVVRTNGGWGDQEGHEFQLDHVLRDWVRADSGAAYPTVLDKMPDTLPFTAKTADIWFETNDDSPGLKTIVKGIMKSSSMRAMKMMLSFDVEEFDVSSMGATVSRFTYLMTHKLDKPKIYVCVASRVWYYCDGKMYNGSDKHPRVKIPSWKPIKIMICDEEFVVLDEDVQKVHRDETSHRTNADIFLILAHEKMRCTKA